MPRTLISWYAINPSRFGLVSGCLIGAAGATMTWLATGAYMSLNPITALFILLHLFALVGLFVGAVGGLFFQWRGRPFSSMVVWMIIQAAAWALLALAFTAARS